MIEGRSKIWNFEEDFKINYVSYLNNMNIDALLWLIEFNGQFTIPGSYLALNQL